MLHDVVEDTEITLDDLRRAGYQPEVIAALAALTRRGHESYEQYIDRLSFNPIARRPKSVDVGENLANNLQSPDAPGNADRIRRYEAGLYLLRAH